MEFKRRYPIKADTGDLRVVPLIFAFLLIVFLFTFSFYSAMKPKLLTFTNKTITSESGRATIQNILNMGDYYFIGLLNSLQYLFYFFIVLSLILAYYIRISKAYLPFFFIIWVVSIIISVMLSNMLWEFVNKQFIQAQANQFPLLIFLIQYLPYITGVYGLLMMIIIYGKPDEERYGYEYT